MQGVECVLFQADSGGLYIVDVGTFSVGDAVRVTGTLDPICISFCQQGNGCVFGGPTTSCSVVNPPQFIRGDANRDGSIDISDAIFVLNSLFGSGSSILLCVDAGDSNDDGAVDISDPIFLLGGLFTQGVLPPPPYPACGFDPTSLDALDCADFAACP